MSIRGQRLPRVVAEYAGQIDDWIVDGHSHWLVGQWDLDQCLVAYRYAYGNVNLKTAIENWIRGQI